MKIKYVLIVSVWLLTNLLVPPLVFAQVRQLYGMTNVGGANGAGVLFQYNPPGNTSVNKFDFDASDGINPFGSLMLASDGNIYGMTYDGGANNFGVLFQYNPVTSTYAKKLDFYYAGAINGSYPRGSLMQALDGNLYGMTEYGGKNNLGVLFQYNPAGNTYEDKYDFGATGVSGSINATSGEYPYGSLIQASDGNLYGMTPEGGKEGYGVLFQYNPVTSVYTKKLDFGAIGVSGPTNGDSPYGSLVKASDGNLYGMTSEGGTAGYGIIFKYNPATSVFTKKFDFTGATNGSNPRGSLIQASDGNLYGMTYAGGANNEGVLFQYNTVDSVFTKELDFAGTTNGSNPSGSLMQASDGNIYGLTTSGGANGEGLLFQYNPSTSVFTKMLDFTGADGSSPELSNLVEIFSTGINEAFAVGSVSLSPNPANNLLAIRISPLSNSESVSISIMNVLGQACRQSEIVNRKSEIELDVSSLPSGVYFVKLIGEKERWVGRFVKE